MSWNLAPYRVAWTAGLGVSLPAWAGAAAWDAWHVRRRLVPRRPDVRGPAWWLHGASAGEVRALATLLASAPGVPMAKLGSSTTEAGLTMWRASGELDAEPAILPVDVPWTWRRALPDDPRLVVLSETELWPELFAALRRRSGPNAPVPVAVASALLSERGLSWRRRTGIVRHAAPAMYVTAQTSADAERYVSLGVPRDQVEVSGSLKWPRAPSAVGADVRKALGVPPDAPVVVAGSIRTKELPLVVAALGAIQRTMAGVRVVIAPRQLRDVSFAQGLLRDAGMHTALLSGSDEPLRNADAVVVDTMGDLCDLYAAGGMAIIGGAWERKGGHNPFEAAVCGIPVVYGPDMRQAGCEMLDRRGAAIRANDAGQLAEAIRERLTSGGGAHEISWPDPIEATWSAWRRWGIGSPASGAG